MAEVIRVENVTKRFGEVAALDRINISFEKGKIIYDYFTGHLISISVFGYCC